MPLILVLQVVVADPPPSGQYTMITQQAGIYRVLQTLDLINDKMEQLDTKVTVMDAKRTQSPLVDAEQTVSST